MNQKVKLFLYFASVFVIFTAIVVVEQQTSEKSDREQAIIDKLEIYSTIAERDSVSQYLPQDLRITLIGANGRVRYDNSADTTQKLENHFSRLEIQQATAGGTGSDVRVSQTTGQKYLYYARKTDSGYLRVALPINDSNESLIAANKNFLLFALALFVVAMVVLWLISRRTGESIMRLHGDVVKGRAERAELKAEMTSSIAHELRTPIATIRGYTETLLDNSLTDEQREHFTRRTHDAAIRLSDLVRDISLLSKLDENRNLFKSETVDLHAITEAMRDEFAGLIKENSITLENALPEGLTITGNHTLLHSIFANLIENSIKYGGKWITVRVELVSQSDKELSLRISDTGAGIDEVHLERIFQRFYRIDNGRSRTDGGSGLGLSIVRHAVLYHGGQIAASRNSQGGLTIDFTLATKN